MTEKFMAPVRWHEATAEERAVASNGCGPEGLQAVIPNGILGLSIRRACDVHDWMYVDGRSEEDRKYADSLFLSNMRALIRKGSFWLRPPRNAVAWVVYKFVDRYGAGPFKRAKNS